MCEYSFELNNSEPMAVPFVIFKREAGRKGMTDFIYGTVFWDNSLELRMLDNRAVLGNAALDWERLYLVVNSVIAAAQMEMAKIK